jgi:hypothetical protein
MKTRLGLRRPCCWNDAWTWEERHLRKMSANTIFMVMISGCISFARACVARAVAHSFSSVHVEKLGTSSTVGGNGAKAGGVGLFSQEGIDILGGSTEQ